MTESRIEEVSGELSGMREQQGEMRQREIQEAWDDLMASLERKDWIDQDDQIKLLKSVLGVK